jgi:hypothetical protein
MRRTIAPLAGLALMALWAGNASAASPTYCAIFAREYLKQATELGDSAMPLRHIHDRAYSKCLNMDDEPPLPTAYTDPDEDGVGGPFIAADDADVPSGAETAVDENRVKQTARLETRAASSKPKRGKFVGSGLPPGSPQWRDWCASHYPNSFDPATGTIIPLTTGKRTPCR